MARYRGPKSKITRRFKEAIFGPDKALERRPYGPGQHGPNRRRKKESEYSVQLAEKQKAKYTYGILERQFRNMFERAQAKPGITGEVLLQFCELRLDNVAFRLNLSPTRRGARQLVSHRHITVNGKVVNIPSYRVRPGDVIFLPDRNRNWLEQAPGNVVRVLGAVNRPGRYQFQDGMTLLDLLAEAGGPTRDALQERIVVVNLSCCANEARSFNLPRFARSSS